jgi:hypothetical protein
MLGGDPPGLALLLPHSSSSCRAGIAGCPLNERTAIGPASSRGMWRRSAVLHRPAIVSINEEDLGNDTLADM